MKRGEGILSYWSAQTTSILVHFGHSSRGDGDSVLPRNKPKKNPFFSLNDSPLSRTPCGRAHQRQPNNERKESTSRAPHRFPGLISTASDLPRQGLIPEPHRSDQQPKDDGASSSAGLPRQKKKACQIPGRGNSQHTLVPLSTRRCNSGHESKQSHLLSAASAECGAQCNERVVRMGEACLHAWVF